VLVRLAEVRHDLLGAARVAADHAHAVHEDLENVVARLLAPAHAHGGRGAGVDDEQVLEAPDVGDVLVAAQHQVDATFREHAQQVAGVGHDVALPPGPGHRHQVVVYRHDLERDGIGEALLDPAVLLAPDAPAVEVGFGRIDPDQMHSVELDLRAAAAEQGLEVDLTDVAGVVVARDDQHPLALDPVEQRAGPLELIEQAHVRQVPRDRDDVGRERVDLFEHRLGERGAVVDRAEVQIGDLSDDDRLVG
jgi:hypothetical protein